MCTHIYVIYQARKYLHVKENNNMPIYKVTKRTDKSPA